MNNRRIPNYDVVALKQNIARLKLDIAKFEAIVEKSRGENRIKQARVFIEAIEKAKKEMAELAEYVELIEGARNGR